MANLLAERTQEAPPFSYCAVDLATFLHEAAAISNGRPLTIDTIHDPHSLTPLTPNHILTMKTRVILPPPGNFQREDLYVKKYWKRVQYLLNVFWSRWKHEYLTSLQPRAKWHKKRRNVSECYIVILKDDQPRNLWRLARVIEAVPEKDGFVRKVKILLRDKSAGQQLNKKTILERPIQKLVTIIEASLRNQDSPDKEPE